MITFCCPVCGQALDLGPEPAACAHCGQPAWIDADGILRLTASDFYYRELPQARLKAILEGGATGDALLERFDAVLSKEGFGFASYIKNYALNPRRAAGISLLDLGPESVALDFGSGWGTVTRCLGGICGSVVSMDLTYDSLLFARRLAQAPNLLHVHGGDGPRLPFADASFDAVILNGVLEWLPEGRDLATDPREVQRRALAEVRRVLRPGGQLYIGIENRLGAPYFLGIPEDHTGLRFGALLPRRLANRYSLRRRGRPYRTYTYSLPGYRTLLGEAGFSCRFFYPWPDYRRFSTIHTDRTLRCRRPAPLPASTTGRARLRRRFTGLAARLLAATGASPYFVPAFAIVGTRRPERGRTSLWERVLARDRLTIDALDAVSLSSTHTLLMRTEQRFFKLALGLEAAARLEDAIRAQALLRLQLPELAAMAQVEVESGRLGRLVYTSEARLQDPDPADPRLIPFLEALIARAQARAGPAAIDVQARSTRLRTFVGGSLNLLRLTEELDRLVAALAGRSWLLGPIHGDLHAGNVLARGDGSLVATDWDRFELAGPRCIDPIHAWLRLAMSTGAQTWSQCLQALGESLAGPGARLRLLGCEVDLADLALYALDRLEKDLSAVPHFAYLGEPWRSQAESVLCWLLETVLPQIEAGDRAYEIPPGTGEQIEDR